jgi:hypothetical protein
MRTNAFSAPAIAYLLIGSAYAALSGRAEGMGEPRTVLFLIIPVLAICQLIVFVRSFRRRVGVQRACINLTAAALVLAAFFLGLRIDSWAFEESERRGDEVLRMIEAVRAETGQCPADLTGLPIGEDLRPAFRGEDWKYRIRSIDGECEVAFDGAAFLICSRDTGSARWWCDG